MSVATTYRLKQYKADFIKDYGYGASFYCSFLRRTQFGDIVYFTDFVFTDRTAKIWDLNRGDEILSLAGHKRDVTVVRYAPTTKLVFTVNQSTIKVKSTRTVFNLMQGPLSQLFPHLAKKRPKHSVVTWVLWPKWSSL